MLNDVVNKKDGELEAIFIFDVSIGLPLYQISTDPEMRKILFGDNDIRYLSVALRDFRNLKQLSKALNSFGKSTKSGSLQYSIFVLQARQLMSYFYDLPHTPHTTVAICFVALIDVPIDRLVDLCENKIDQIKNELNKG
ncbi:MAG: hypothetical protein SAL70_09710 [Scytonema sp. PMC 1070.18]|nr:hypothetical protein [Scytonema sp. PMC 1070.18]